MEKNARGNANSAYPYTYKLIDIKSSNLSSNLIAIAEETACSQLREFDLNQLLSTDEYLLGFSPADIKKMTQLACVDKLTPNYAIVAYDFLEEGTEAVLHIADWQNYSVSKVTVSELVCDQTMLNKFSSLDAYRIGYLQGINAVDIQKNTLPHLEGITLDLSESEQ